MTRGYTMLKFVTPVEIGGRNLERWSIQSGGTDSLMQAIRVEDVDDRWFALVWSGVNPPQRCEVRWSNVAQRKWEDIPDAPARKDAKK